MDWLIPSLAELHKPVGIIGKDRECRYKNSLLEFWHLVCRGFDALKQFGRKQRGLWVQNTLTVFTCRIDPIVAVIVAIWRHASLSQIAPIVVQIVLGTKSLLNSRYMAISKITHAERAEPNSTRQQEVAAAMQLWQTIEYLSPQKPPKVEMTNDSCVWELDSTAPDDRHMPWRDEKKQSQIKRIAKPKQSHSFTLFGGVVTGAELVETVRELVGARPIDLSEQKAPEGGASFVIPIDRLGRVAGEIFISSVPWAMSCIAHAQKTGQSFQFSGFFGSDGVQEKFKSAMQVLLKERNLIKEEKEEASGRTVKRKAGASQPVGTSTQAFNAQKITDPESNPLRTLDSDDVRAIAELVFAMSGWAPMRPDAWFIKAQRCDERGVKRSSDDPLNSFYAEEIEKVQQAYLAGQAGTALKQFLETPEAADRCDLESTREHLIAGTHPSLTPLACWPSEFPLVTSQQFAVNAIMRDLKNGGLFSVNGPPGTGKTTMLKDILASVVTQRADQLLTFNNPLEAFSRRLDIEGVNFPTWKLHDKLRGFGVVVACVNNGAAENISKDLPGLGAIDQTVDVNYFATVADSYALPDDALVRSEKSWGMVSAALGNSENRTTFARDFWFGRKKPNDKADSSAEDSPAELDPMRLYTLQEWFKDFAHLAPNWEDAKANYENARAAAKAALDRAAILATHLQSYQPLKAQLVKIQAKVDATSAELSNLQMHAVQAQKQVTEALAAWERSKAVIVAITVRDAAKVKAEDAQKVFDQLLPTRPNETAMALSALISSAERARERVIEDWNRHQPSKPRYFSLNWSRKTAWTVRDGKLQAEFDRSRRTLSDLEAKQNVSQVWENDFATAKADLQACNSALSLATDSVLKICGDAQLPKAKAKTIADQCSTEHLRCVAERDVLAKKVSDCKTRLEDFRCKLKAHQDMFRTSEELLLKANLLGDTRNAWRLNDVARDDFHRASPYHDERELLLTRRALFVAALDLHKAFIVHAWSKLKQSLMRCMYMLQGQIAPELIKGGPMELWDSLFLVVPLISSTFASFPRLFRGVGQEQLAWVLIDEAGQAAPQNCVGALWRAKRAVVVGDPRQLEPVVGLPEELVNPLREHCGTHHRYVPPLASTQTMADISNRFGMYLGATDEEKGTWLGSPLLVHRRCIDPMFHIANTIAYEGKMVYGGGADKLGDSVLHSCWLNERAEGADGHWIQAQADRVLRMMEHLLHEPIYSGEGKLRLYIISPFKKVALSMRQVLEGAGYSYKVAKEMCGTVHTFQGREADYVIFLLGGDPERPGVISGFAGKNPNLVNVALTRAKKRFYVVGDKSFWTGDGDTNDFYGRMARALDGHAAAIKRRK